MERNEEGVKLWYNTEMEKLNMPEYGRNILNLVETLREIPDRAKRSEQAKAVVKAMEILNPQIHTQENYEQVLWDQLYMIADYDLDIDSPYPMPQPEKRLEKPMVIPLKKSPIKASHYGRNIESIIDLIAGEEEGPVKRSMLSSLAIYMRQQYLIWNKDSVADETIFADIEKLSGYRIKVPADLELSKISFGSSNFSRPGLNLHNHQRRGGQRKQGGRKNRK